MTPSTKICPGVRNGASTARVEVGGRDWGHIARGDRHLGTLKPIYQTTAPPAQV